MKLRVIFASLILGLGLVANQANATTTIIDDSPAAHKVANTLLASNAQKQFTAYMEQRFGRFAKRSEWQEFSNVISQYNENTIQVLNFDADAQRKFNESATAVTKKLGRKNSAEAIAWQEHTNNVVRMLNFIWNVAADQAQPTDNE